MYRLINTTTGAVLGVVENPRFITRHPEGFFYGVDREKATGVAYKSIPYNLFGTEGVGAEETVLPREFDGGDSVVATARNTAGIAAIENALCEQDAAAEARMAAIEDALCELDKN